VVPGRGRYKVEGLFRCESLRQFLEARLLRYKDVSYVSASTLTGNLLISFNSENSHQKIARRIRQVLREVKSASKEPIKKAAETTSSRDSAPGKPGPSLRAKKLIRQFSGQKENEPISWHTLKKETVMDTLDTHDSLGLGIKTAEERYRDHGPNVLPEPTARSKWKIFVSQFNSLPVGLLGAAAGISALTTGILDAVVITGVVVANAAIGYFTESEAETTIRSLKGRVQPFAQVIRDGQSVRIPAEEVVPGDLLLLRPGTYVVADSRIVETYRLTIDESALTGETVPSTKTWRTLKRDDVPLGDRHNMAFMGTVVTGGQGAAIVVATGRHTEIGRLQMLLEETTSPETPIEKQLSRIGDQLVLLSGAICGVVFLMGFFRGYGLLLMLRMSVSLAAAAVPEGLPAAATTTLALGVRKMREHGALIRQVEAVETLGTVQTVCLDKTGTITWNRMAVVKIFSGMRRFNVVDGRVVSHDHSIDPEDCHELFQLARIGALCNETQVENNDSDGPGYTLRGTPTESALVVLATGLGMDVLKLRSRNTLLKVKHRAENRLFMSTLHAVSNGERLLAMKGSPAEVLAMCAWQLQDGEPTSLTEEVRLKIETENTRMAGEGLRVLGLACLTKGGDDETPLDRDLVWLGLIGMADPIREGVKAVIKGFHRAGIDTVMITGDQSPTAHAVARQLDLSKGEPLEILDSSQLASMDPKTLKALGQKVHVYARVSPADKLKIVQALQEAGQIIAMTGDGINDGPALKAADVGIAMGHSGTDVAREVADVVLERDELETLMIAVEDGRTIHNNIKKSVHFFLATNLSEIMVMFTALATGIGFPLNAMQLLWINIISDIFPGLALSLEAPEPDVLDQPPRHTQEPIFSSGEYKRMGLEAAVISASALGTYAFGLTRYGAGARAGTLAFQSLTIGQLLHAVGCRSERYGFLDKRLPSNKYLNGALASSLGLQMLTMWVPGLRSLLGVAPVNLLDGLVIGGSALLSLIVNETTKKMGLVKK
jgi:Ca2+-transporting ATPase